MNESDEDTDEYFNVNKEEEPEVESDDEIIESDFELEGETVEADNDSPQKMGDPNVEVTEESRDAAQVAKGKAMEAISEGNFDQAIEHLTEAILLNPTSAIIYRTRATVYIKMKKPSAAIRDATAALEESFVSTRTCNCQHKDMQLNKGWLGGADLAVFGETGGIVSYGNFLSNAKPGLQAARH